MLNATSLCHTQIKTLRTLTEVLRDGNPAPIVANNEKLAPIAAELHQMRESINQRHQIEAPIYCYVVWRNSTKSWRSFYVSRMCRVTQAHAITAVAR